MNSISPPRKVKRRVNREEIEKAEPRLIIVLFLSFFFYFVFPKALLQPLEKELINAITFPIRIIIIESLIAYILLSNIKDEIKQSWRFSLGNIKNTKIYKYKPKFSTKTKSLYLAGLLSWMPIVISGAKFQPALLFCIGSILLLWSTLLALEENGVYSFLNTWKSDKIFISFLIAAITFWGGYTSASQINNVFYIDSSYFPFTFSAMTVYNIARLTTYFTIPTTVILMIFALYDAMRTFRSKPSRVGEISLFLVPMVYFAITGLIINEENVIKKSLIEISYSVDFNKNSHCDNSSVKNKPVIFLGPNSEKVLVKLYDKKDKFSIKDCFEK